MTPREADVAYVLEGVEGVVSVQTIVGSPHLDFAVGVRDIMASVRAQAALQRVLSHVEFERVMFHREGLPGALSPRAKDLHLRDVEREAARARVPARAPSYGDALPKVDPNETRILVVDDAAETAAAVTKALPHAAVVVAPRTREALDRAKKQPFDVFVCSVERAFGADGFLVMLKAFDTFGVARVVLVSHPQDLRFTINRLERMGHYNSVLVRPLDGPALEHALRFRGVFVQAFSIPVPPVRGEASSFRRVLVVDDDPRCKRLVGPSKSISGIGINVTLASDVWEALDRIEADWDAVVCSIAMKSETGTPLYRMLWNACPASKKRFAFLASADSAPISGVSHVMRRPLSLEAIALFVDAHERF